MFQTYKTKNGLICHHNAKHVVTEFNNIEPTQYTSKIYFYTSTLLIPSSGCFFLSKVARNQWQLLPIGSLFYGKYIQWGNKFLPIVEAYLEPSQNFMKLFCKNS